MTLREVGQPFDLPTPEQVRAAILSALHCTTGADERWLRYRAEAPNDERLQALIGRELGISGGVCGWGMHYDYRGGNNPAIMVGTDIVSASVMYGDGTLIQGKALVDAVRNLLDIPSPETKDQLKLF